MLTLKIIQTLNACQGLQKIKQQSCLMHQQKNKKQLAIEEEGKVYKIENSSKEAFNGEQPQINHPPITHKQNGRHSTSDAKRQPSPYDENGDLNKSSIRNKVSLNLPCLSSFHSNYGDRIFDKQSASTLQKTILVYSIPKANRFNNDPKYNGEPAYCIDTCFKSNPFKGAGFGFGRKKQYPQWMERNMKENPAPGAYFQSETDIRGKGKTFGISHKYYQKVLIPKEKHSSFQVAKKLSPIHDKIK